MVLLVAVAAFGSTFLGGIFALRLKDQLHLILGFSAGAVVGAAFFDLMLEALRLGGGAYPAVALTTVMAVGFLTYLVVDRLVLIHRGLEGETHGRRGSLGAGSLSVHSFLDGIGLGLAFQVSSALGWVVALAVLAHDFSDGINTVNFVLKNGGQRKLAFRWLLADASAPVAGVVATLFFKISESELGLLLALFTGFFLYIGASELIPESHHAHPVRWTTVATVLGAGLLYGVIKLAG